MANDVLNRAKYGWTKWFGANRELLKNDDPFWTCQVCASQHPSSIPCFMAEIFEEEFVKLCTKCHRIQKDNNITSVQVLIEVVRKG